MNAIHVQCGFVLDGDVIAKLADVLQQTIEKSMVQHTQALVKAFEDRPSEQSLPTAAPVEPSLNTPEPFSDERELISGKEVAKLLDVSFRTVYRLRDSGKMPQPIRLGSLVRWNRKEIESWIEAGCPSERRRRKKSR